MPLRDEHSDEQRGRGTPFARVLTDFMWSQRPPWSAMRVANSLGIHRARVANWIYKGMTPELDTLLVVMRRLGIPMNKLLDAYAEEGIPVPDLQPDAAAPSPKRNGSGGESGSASNVVSPAPLAPSADFPVPPARRGRGGGVRNLVGQPVQTPETAAPVESADEAQEWETMLAHTREVMRNVGMPKATITAVLRQIEDARSGKPSLAHRRIAEEHAVSYPADHLEDRAAKQTQREPNGEPEQLQPTTPKSR